MPQPGLHAILALATRRKSAMRRWFALGLVFGALLPDADSYPQAYAIVVRGWTPTLLKQSTTAP
jgi:hypothetical protein